MEQEVLWELLDIVQKVLTKCPKLQIYTEDPKIKVIRDWVYTE